MICQLHNFLLMDVFSKWSMHKKQLKTAAL